MRSRRAEWLELAGAAFRRVPLSVRRRILKTTNDVFLLGVVGLVVDDTGRVLLLDHRFRVPWRWGLPGGYVRFGETLLEALGREIREETALRLAIDPVPFDTELNLRTETVSVTLRARVVGSPDITCSAEIAGGGFYGPDELPAGIYPHHETVLARFFERSRD